MEQDRSASEESTLASLLMQEATDAQTAPERLIELGAIGEIRLLVAANTGTPSAYLEELSQDENEQVRRAVAQNPNTPLACLLRLAREFPEAFFLNPLCSLLNLAQPGWYAQITDLTWLALLKSEKIPRRWLNWVEEQKRRTDTAINSELRQPRDLYGVWVAARLHVDMPELHAHGEHIGRELAESIAIVVRHERTPAPLLAELAAIVCQYTNLAEIGNAVCEQVKRGVALNVAAPEQVLRSLAADTDTIVRHRVGKNTQTPLDMLELLSADASAYVRSGVVANQATPVEILERLGRDNTYDEKYEQAKQQIEPGATLHEFSRMQAQEALNNIKLVKGALARNECTPARMLVHLVSHPEVEVRERLAANPAAPAEVLTRLAADVERVVEAVLVNPRLPAEALVQLASSRHTAKARVDIASHFHTPASVLAGLATDSEMRVREAVAQNERTPVESLARLMTDNDSLVRAAVAKNSAAPREMLARLVNDPTKSVRLALAQNTNLSEELIEQLSEDKDHDVREQIVCHSALPLSSLERMVEDTDSTVKSRVQLRLDRLSFLGERAQQRYSYWRDINHTYKEEPRQGVSASVPLYEIQARALEYTSSNRHDPYLLREFLDHFQLPTALQQEIFELLLPTWSQKRREHIKQSESWLALLTEIDLSTEWQRVFANSPLWQERYVMAVKPGIEMALLEQLAIDGNRYVRAAARWYLLQRCEITPE